ncbi:heme-binding protein [Ruegeria sp. HKCCD8929]|uniref:heme-binding protein n=1 Tax=Ruegeria sp. HKCCD8929 TaxID=2683006 RepID=UPI0014878585|nr:heme-binding protein [Ruegeria sp. HKCCD8929]
MSAPLPEALLARFQKFIEEWLNGPAAALHLKLSPAAGARRASAMGRDIASVTQFIGENPQLDGPSYMDSRKVLQGGGLTIRIGSALVGGIGVRGTPEGQLDEGCACAGLGVIGAG